MPGRRFTGAADAVNAGAALDVFATEPLPADDPLSLLDNMILTPRAIGLSDLCFADTGRTNVEAILAVFKREAPADLLNPQVLDRSAYQRRPLQHRRLWRSRSP